MYQFSMWLLVFMSYAWFFQDSFSWDLKRPRFSRVGTISTLRAFTQAKHWMAPRQPLVCTTAFNLRKKHRTSIYVHVEIHYPKVAWWSTLMSLPGMVNQQPFTANCVHPQRAPLYNSASVFSKPFAFGFTWKQPFESSHCQLPCQVAMMLKMRAFVFEQSGYAGN